MYSGSSQDNVIEQKIHFQSRIQMGEIKKKLSEVKYIYQTHHLQLIYIKWIDRSMLYLARRNFGIVNVF